MHFRIPFLSSSTPRIFPEDFTAKQEHFGVAPWRQKLNDLRLSAEGKLQRQVEANNAYPFDEVGPKIYEFSIRYNALYWAVAGLIVAVAFTVYLAKTNDLENHFFLLPVILIVICCAAIYDYKDRRLYQLNRNILEYRFLYNDRLHVCGGYHNIYVRLKRETRSGHHRPHYYLVLNGYMIDSYRISGTTRNVDELRRLGQKIAQHLNLNYFDEGNASPLHVIRHLPPTRTHVFSYPVNNNAEPVIPILKGAGNDPVASATNKEVETINKSQKNDNSDLVRGNEKIPLQTRLMLE